MDWIWVWPGLNSPAWVLLQQPQFHSSSLGSFFRNLPSVSVPTAALRMWTPLPRRPSMTCECPTVYSVCWLATTSSLTNGFIVGFKWMLSEGTGTGRWNNSVQLLWSIPEDWLGWKRTQPSMMSSMELEAPIEQSQRQCLWKLQAHFPL